MQRDERTPPADYGEEKREKEGKRRKTKETEKDRDAASVYSGLTKESGEFSVHGSVYKNFLRSQLYMIDLQCPTYKGQECRVIVVVGGPGEAGS